MEQDQLRYPDMSYRKPSKFKLVMPSGSSSLCQIVVDSIVDNLLAGRLKPGDKLPTEPELCERFTISRNTVREAIKMLSILGVVTIRRGDGTYIADHLSSMVFNPLLLGLALEPRAETDIVQLRKILDISSADFLLRHFDKEFFEQLDELNYEILRKASSSPPDKLLEMDLNFHETLHRKAGNQLIVYLYATLHRMLAPVLLEAISRDPTSIYETHTHLISAFRARNIDVVRSTIMQQSF